MFFKGPCGMPMVLPAMLEILSSGDLAGHESDDIPAQNGDGHSIVGITASLRTMPRSVA